MKRALAMSREAMYELIRRPVITEKAGSVKFQDLIENRTMTEQTAVALANFPVKVFYTAFNLVTGQPRDVYGPMSLEADAG